MIRQLSSMFLVVAGLALATPAWSGDETPGPRGNGGGAAPVGGLQDQPKQPLLLLPAVQAAREAARRTSASDAPAASGQEHAFVTLSNGDVIAVPVNR